MSAPWAGTPFEAEYHRLQDRIDAALARVASLVAALDQADRWIRLQGIGGNRDGACVECFPGNTIPPAFAGFRCAWHHAHARARCEHARLQAFKIMPTMCLDCGALYVDGKGWLGEPGPPDEEVKP